MASLTQLPREVLAEIISYLGPSDVTLDSAEAWYRPRSCLFHLAVCCRRLSEFAIPKLYEVCNLNMRTVPLLRALAKSPTNAAHVRKVILSVDGSPASDRIFTATDAALFNRILMRHAEPHSVGLLPSTGSVSPDTAGELHNAEVLAAVMVALTPNVKNIVSTNTGKHQPRFRTGSLARLESVALHHMSTSGGCSLDDIAGILKAAPSLKRFVGFGISDMPDSFSHYGVKEVLLSHSQLKPGAVARWFTAFPQLEAFRYEGGGLRGRGSDEPMPREFWSGVLKRKSTLRHLALQQEEMCLIYYSDRNVTEDDLLGSLSSMEVLETIQLHAGYLYLDHKPRRDEPCISSVPGAAADEYAWYLQSIRKDRMRTLDEANEERATNLPMLVEADGSGEEDGDIEANEHWETLYSQHAQGTGNQDRYDTNVDDDVKANEDDSAAEPQHTLEGSAHGRLAAFLPKSIRKLTIIGLATFALTDIWDLIHVLPEQFPVLKEVNFPGMPGADDPDGLAEDFEYSGIKFSSEEESINIHGEWAI